MRRAIRRSRGEGGQLEDNVLSVPQVISGSALCDLRPAKRDLEDSTLQKRSMSFLRFGKDYGETFYLVIQCVRTGAPARIVDQEFAVAVVLEADTPHLYNSVRLRVQPRARVRV